MRNGTEKPFHAIDINVNYFYKKERVWQESRQRDTEAIPSHETHAE